MRVECGVNSEFRIKKTIPGNDDFEKKQADSHIRSRTAVRGDAYHKRPQPKALSKHSRAANGGSRLKRAGIRASA